MLEPAGCGRKTRLFPREQSHGVAWGGCIDYRLSNLVNCLPNIKAECRTRARSAQLSLLHCPSLSKLIFSSSAGQRRNGRRPQWDNESVALTGGVSLYLIRTQALWGLWGLIYQTSSFVFCFFITNVCEKASKQSAEERWKKTWCSLFPVPFFLSAH